MIIHHESIIDTDSFDLIKSGVKRLKFYLNDTKRQRLQSGDKIKYINKITQETIYVEVKHITYAQNAKELVKTLNLDKNHVDYINKWFRLEDQDKYGLLGVKIERCTL